MEKSDKRYQVFVSSTYTDLKEERQEVIQALLELNCIPSGMEMFPAADEDQWTLIKQVIDDCDYYLVIIAGRYGSLSSTGKSYTQMEYEYAVEKNIPVAAFIHEKPGDIAADKTEPTDAGKAKLQEFKKLVEQKMCKYWTSPSDLGGKVSRSVANLIKTRPREGWVRAGQVPDENTSKTILRLKQRIEELQEQVAAAQKAPPAGTADLAQGDDPLKLTFRYTLRTAGALTSKERVVSTTYNEVFAAISPLMIDKASEQQLSVALREHFGRQTLGSDEQIALMYGGLVQKDFQELKIQLRALGLIEKSTSPRSVKDTSTYWTLTPYGDSLMTQLYAKKRSAGTNFDQSTASPPTASTGAS
jgi:hypothetical protein